MPLKILKKQIIFLNSITFVGLVVCFVVSMKYSGTEAFFHSGPLTYVKWGVLGALVNIGFILKAKSWGERHYFLTTFLMIGGIGINIIISTKINFENWYNILPNLMILMSILILICFIINVRKYARNIQS
jgi:hypothetical protein